MYYNSVLDLIGNTPLVKINKLNPNKKVTLLAKLEFMNPGGSVKDRIGMSMLRSAEKKKKINKNSTIVEPTSGNTGVGIALYSVIKGYKNVFVMPDKMSDEKRNVLRAYGAKVVVTPTNVDPEDERSYYKVSDRLSKEIKGAYKPDQYHNQSNPEAHYETTGPEIWKSTEGKITHFVCGMGTGGTITGVAKYLKEKNKRIKIVGVDPYGSVFHKVKKTGKYTNDDIKPYKTEGIGEDFVPSTIDLSLVDDIVQIGDKEAFAITRRLAREEAILAGGSSGMAVAGAMKFVQKLKKGVVVVLLPDSGKSYISKIFNDDWMRDNAFMQVGLTDISAIDILDTKKSKKVITISSNETVKKAIDLMKDKEVSQLPVLKRGKVVGKVNEKLLLDGLFNKTVGPSNQIAAVMDTSVNTVNEKESIDWVSKLLAKDNLVLVVNNKNKPIGVITRIDLVEYYA